jgi:hypothetical protein
MVMKNDWTASLWSFACKFQGLITVWAYIYIFS